MKNQSNWKHHKHECEVFESAKCKFQNISDPKAICIQLDCITPLRMILRKETDPDRWNNEVSVMEDHENERKDSPHWKVDQINVVGYLLGPCKLKDKVKVDENLIQKVIGILEVNAFEAKTVDGSFIRCLYPKLAILAHSCKPNTAHSSYPSKDFLLQARTTVPVKTGEMIYSCYTYTMNGTVKRQEHLKVGKFFDCRCERCLSSTELETHVSSLVCQKCLEGFVIMKNPPSNDTWTCNNESCAIEISGAEIDSQISHLEDEIDEVLYEHSGSNKFKLIEELLLKLNKSLHENHFLQIFVKNVLIDLYSKMEKKLNVKQLRRKVELSREILKVLDVLESGKTRARGMTLFALAKTFENLAKTKEELSDLATILKECSEILCLEDESSIEGKMGRIAEQRLKEVYVKKSILE